MNKPKGKKHACGILRLWRKGLLADLKRRNITRVEGGILAKAVLAQGSGYICLSGVAVGWVEGANEK